MLTWFENDIFMTSHTICNISTLTRVCVCERQQANNPDVSSFSRCVKHSLSGRLCVANSPGQLPAIPRHNVIDQFKRWVFTVCGGGWNLNHASLSHSCSFVPCKFSCISNPEVHLSSFFSGAEVPPLLLDLGDTLFLGNMYSDQRDRCISFLACLNCAINYAWHFQRKQQYRKVSFLSNRFSIRLWQHELRKTQYWSASPTSWQHSLTKMTNIPLVTARLIMVSLLLILDPSLWINLEKNNKGTAMLGSKTHVMQDECFHIKTNVSDWTVILWSGVDRLHLLSLVCTSARKQYKSNFYTTESGASAQFACRRWSDTDVSTVCVRARWWLPSLTMTGSWWRAYTVFLGECMKV